jgi:hypothetical protein
VSEVIKEVYVVYLPSDPRRSWQVVCRADQIPPDTILQLSTPPKGKVHISPIEIFYTDAEEIMNQGRLGPTKERYIPERFVFGIDDHHGVINAIFDLR